MQFGGSQVLCDTRKTAQMDEAHTVYLSINNFLSPERLNPQTLNGVGQQQILIFLGNIC